MKAGWDRGSGYKRSKLILKVHVDSVIGLQPFQARRIAFGLGLDQVTFGTATRLMTGLYKAFESTDASLVEINPLVMAEDGKLYALDAKMNLDDNALFRQPKIREMRDFSEGSPWRSSHLVMALATLSWTETSAAWSTARVWPWPPWTLLDSLVGIGQFPGCRWRRER